MIPVKLALRNFLSYTEIHDPLVFAGIHVACLSGENGAGKSTLLDAITWALWGESRARTNAQLVHAGKTDMEVELEFELAGALYRVIRKWTARGTRGSGTTLLDLAVCDDGAFRSIAGNSIPDTEKKVVDLLRMTYDTFTNSSFILQNRADTFALATPAQRKTVLTEILELAEYDRLQERAGREVREREVRHRALEGQIREADEELARRPEYAADAERLTARVAELDEQVKEHDVEFRAVREQLSALTSSRRELDDVLERMAGTRAEVGRLTDAIRDHAATLDAARAMLAQERDIDQGYAGLQRARKQVEDLAGKLEQFASLCQERNQLDRIVATARAGPEAELNGVGQQLARAEADARRLADHEQAAMKVRGEQRELLRLHGRLTLVDGELATARERVAEMKGANDRLKREMLDLKARIDRLDGVTACPICQSPLDPTGRSALVDRYTAEGKAQSAEFRDNASTVKELGGQVQQKEADRAGLIAEIGRLDGVERRLARAEAAVEGARQAAVEAEEARARVVALTATLEQQAYARQEQEQLDAIRLRLDALGYDDATYRRVRDEAARLAAYETKKRDLETARQVVAHREQALDEARRQLDLWQERLSKEQAHVAALRERTRELPNVAARAAEVERLLAERRRAYTDANRELGEAHQRLAYLERAEAQRKERLAQLDGVLREKALYAELQAAFGKNGIQALLIETAIPEIEDEANRLLTAMTESRMHVTFSTQRARAAGEGVIETLDIVINDELGARPYEMYSGGEAFRVNFAIRIALSKLLARRAGARLQTLVIDEGFGSQDDAGRERLVEAIKSVEDQFAMILVITHLDDLKERFPVRIDVRKTALGSTYEIEWAG